MSKKKDQIKEDGDLRVLTLIIKQTYFDAILQGRKVQEVREIRPTNEKKYIQIDESGYPVEDENGNCVPREYDAIRFFVGYEKGRDEALVKVLNAHTEICVDDRGNMISYDYMGEEYFAEVVIYELGEILDVKTKHRDKSN